MQITTTNRKPRKEALSLFVRRPPRVRRTHEAIETAVRRMRGPIGELGVLVGERRLVSIAHPMTRAGLEALLVRRSRYTHGLERLRVLAVADAVRASPEHLAPVVIATTEGRVILQWLEELPS